MVTKEVEFEDEYKLLAEEENVFNNDSSDPSEKKKGGKALYFFFMIFVIILVLAGIVSSMWFFLDRKGEEDQKRILTEKAEAVLSARFIDNDVDNLISLRVRMNDDDKLIVTWTTGDNASQKTCTAPVLVSRDEQLFGIKPIDNVAFSKQDPSKGFCVATSGLKFGLPLK